MENQIAASSQTRATEQDVGEVEADVLCPEGPQRPAQSSNVVTGQLLSLRVAGGARRRELKRLALQPLGREGLYESCCVI